MGKARLALYAGFATVYAFTLLCMFAVCVHYNKALTSLDTTKHQLAQVQVQLRDNTMTLNTTKKFLSDDENTIADQEKKLRDESAQLQAAKEKLAKEAQVSQVLASRSGGDAIRSIVPLGTFRASWYTSYDAGVGSITATGTRVQDGRTIAVDPHMIPLGSRLYVVFPDGHTHIYVAEDTGGAIHGNRLDIYCTRPSQAERNGIESVKIYIIK